MSSSQNRPFNILNNDGTLFNQRRKNRQYRRKQRRARFINNQDTLNRIANLPIQVINDPSIDKFFNGF